MELREQVPPPTEARPNVPSFQPQRSRPRYWLHIVLFVLTLISTTTIWGFWSGMPATSIGDLVSWGTISSGLIFSTALLGFLTVHEFGHYFAARNHRIDATLPYYIPLPFVGIGTLGAVIRIKSAIPSRTKLFDVGASGPLAGFVVALVLLIVALVTLPPVEYVNQFDGHDTLKEFVSEYGTFPAEIIPAEDIESSSIVVGQTILYWAVTQFFADVPPMFEMYHYPLLFAAWLGLFFTALNMLPVGQLDGGHILYSLVGPRWHRILARAFVVVLLASGSIGLVSDSTTAMMEIKEFLGPFVWFVLAGILYFYLYKVFAGDHKWIAPVLAGLMLVAVSTLASPELAQSVGYSGWLIWCLLIVFLIKVDHPPVYVDDRLSTRRKVLGVLSFVVFVLCFSIKPIAVV